MDFPGGCTYQHSYVPIKDATEYRQHYMSSHLGLNHTTSDVQKAFQGGSGNTSVKTSNPTTAYGKLRISKATQSNITSQAISDGLRPSLKSAVSAVTHVLSNGDPLAGPDIGYWLPFYLMWVLATCSSNKTYGTGSFVARFSNPNIPEREILWEDFFQQLSKAPSMRGYQLTPRRFQQAMDPLLLETYQDSTLEALQDVKRQGTVHSRKVRLADGSSPPPWAPVADLFPSLRSTLSLEVVTLLNSHAQLEDSDASPDWLGLDQGNEGATSNYEAAGYQSATRHVRRTPRDFNAGP